MNNINSMMFLTKKKVIYNSNCEKLNLVLNLERTPKWSKLQTSNVFILNSGAYLTGQIHTKICKNEVFSVIEI